MSDKGLTFEKLSERAKVRCPDFGYDIDGRSPNYWGIALAGEIGELMDHLKILEDTGEVNKEEIGKEIADVVIYADLLAQRFGLNLGKLVEDKFNEVSKRINSNIVL